MKKVLFLIAIFLLACREDNVIEEEVCNREVECSEYPTWQSWKTFIDGYSNYQCEPCWRGHHREQKGDCCICSEIGLEWCNREKTGMYVCTYFGEFDYYSCSGSCASFMYPYGHTCYENDFGEAYCDCRFEY